MNIVVLDGHTLNPGDLSWEPLNKFGTVTLHARTSKAELPDRLRGADAVLTNKVMIDAATLEQFPALKYIGVTATGYNCVDTEAARKRKIVVTNVPTYGTHSVAQATFALLLELTNAAGAHAQTVRQGQWCESKDFCYWNSPQVELSGLTLGLVGYGRIGRAVATIARAFGMQVIVHTRTPSKIAGEEKCLDVDTVFASSDVVSLHCPLTPENKQFVNAARLAQMKRSAFLINTSRGMLIDEAALADALNKGVIAGAGLDVLSVEPPEKTNPLLSARNCIVTPHNAWATRAARSRLLETVVENLAAFVAGKPQNAV